MLVDQIWAAVMSVSGPSSTDAYDHAILLVDGSGPSSPPDLGSDTWSPTSSIEHTTSSPLSRKWTLREELARRRYTKWHEGRFNERDGEPLGESILDVEGREGSTQESFRGRTEDATASPSAGARSPSRGMEGSPRLVHTRPREVYEVDVLHENQRGSFICGVPLYSHRSLLHFDPAPWTNISMKDSLVDITNAQLPDPTWEWAWRSWFVDMSADVDEEGWQYSFAFSPAFSWHGNQLWFHSFVRRRRWLRKRVKRHPAGYGHVSIGLLQTRPLSARATHACGSVTGTSHRLSRASGGHLGEDDGSHKICDLVSLMATLRSGRLDREKIEAVSSFVEHGDEDIAHLAGHVSGVQGPKGHREFRAWMLTICFNKFAQMHEVMSLLIYQASRRQLLARLFDTFSNMSEYTKGDREAKDTQEAISRRTDDLQKAITVAEEQVKRLEYWSDIKETIRHGDPDHGWGPRWQGIDSSRSQVASDVEQHDRPRRSSSKEDSKHDTDPIVEAPHHR